jgi:hypothetical protein
MLNCMILRSGEVFFSDCKCHENFFPDFEHDAILVFWGLSDRSQAPGFVKCRISPPEKRWGEPLDKWLFECRQDILPDWFSVLWGEEIVREELPQWIARHVVETGSVILDNDGFNVKIPPLGNTVKIFGLLGIFRGDAEVTIKKIPEGKLFFYENAKCFGVEKIMQNKRIRINGDVIAGLPRETVEKLSWFGSWKGRQ